MAQSLKKATSRIFCCCVCIVVVTVSVLVFAVVVVVVADDLGILSGFGSVDDVNSHASVFGKLRDQRFNVRSTANKWPDPSSNIRTTHCNSNIKVHGRCIPSGITCLGGLKTAFLL